MLKEIYTTPEVELLKFKSALAIADFESQPGFEFGEGDKEEDGDL